MAMSSPHHLTTRGGTGNSYQGMPSGMPEMARINAPLGAASQNRLPQGLLSHEETLLLRRLSGNASCWHWRCFVERMDTRNWERSKFDEKTETGAGGIAAGLHSRD